MRMFYGFLAGLLLHVAVVSTSRAAIVVSSDGSDGVFNPTSSVEIDLGLATTAAWNTPSPVAGQGVYDSAKWAAVFKYSSVNIPSGVTVTFKNHPSNPPVVWLVSGNAIIDGIIQLNGQNYTGVDLTATIPGPGGFRGGRRAPSSDGFGPHGGIVGVDYGVFDYSNPRIIPLIGGSGGRAGSPRGGAGGGAILIAASDTLRVNGTVEALGGAGSWPGNATGSGSGGAIRLVGDVVEGAGQLDATAVHGASGRIRIEGNSITYTNSGNPAATLGITGPLADLWPAATDPTLSLVSLGGMPIPADPNGQFVFPNPDVLLSSSAPATLVLDATNLPTNSVVTVHLTPRTGQRSSVTAIYVGGSAAASTWQASLPLAGGYTAIQARAVLP